MPRFTTRTSAVALTSAALMGLSTLALPGAAGAQEVDCDPAAATYAVTGGTIEWGVKQSFRSYLKSNIAQGDWELSEGVTFVGDETGVGHFVWPIAADAGTVSENGAIASGTGDVVIRGHHDVLHSTLSNPTVEINGNEGVLKMDYRAKKVEEFHADSPYIWLEGEQTRAITFNLDEAPDFQQEGTVTMETGSATMEPEFIAAFADMYSTEDEMDPITLSLDVTATCDADDNDDDQGEVPSGGLSGSLSDILGSLP